MNLFKPCILALFGWSAMVSHAVALIDIQPKIAEVRDTAMTVEIANNGERPEYVSITLSRIINPGVELADERLELISQTPRPQLYASPFKLKLAPGQSKIITLKPLEQVEKEQVYRLDIKPVMNVLEPKQADVVGTVLINLAFSALVRHLPLIETSTLSVTCDSEGARLIATGTTHFLVEGATANGQSIDPFGVYPDVPIVMRGRNIQISAHPPCL
ncbi:hypothetical protein P3C29_29605 [Pseudomonas sp. 1912-s]|uniref:hypothetical protein n=1 Tax=Pseudomonas sp. 1912-s TaxID=3033802 RepID=UPI0023E00BD4|nr:hypothetical protein [Pseudomonas sp. 1912-s]MDF3202852.1 hypothetical protein [Pseudomonas sp. 1912-s]